MVKNITATIFGGTGFVGTQIIRELADKGIRIKIATRVPERAYDLKPCGMVGQIAPFVCDYSDKAIESAVQNSDYVVNCVGILYEKGKSATFQKIHTDLPARIASACKKAKVKRFVHISALGIENNESKYAQSKRDGEEAILKNFSQATILRPSVIFGEDDSFFNKFARMMQIMPAMAPLPLIGGGKTKFQPVFVGDVADAVVKCLENKETQGKIYELGGPHIVTFKEFYKLLFTYTNRKRPLMPMPFALAKLMGAFLKILPNPPLTPDQVESLKSSPIVNEGALTLKDLGINATSMTLILPTYLKSYRPGGRFGGVIEHTP